MAAFLFVRPETVCAQVKKVTPDSTAAVTVTDSLSQTTDTLKVAARKGGVETTINYNAQDSIRFDVISKTMFLFGKAHIDYGTTSLDAEQIQINWETSTLTANGAPDSTGKIIGTPLFKDGADQYETDKITYNYKTKRGKISGAVTKQGEGYIHAETVKKNADNTLFGQNAQYTTCDLAHPHFYINASKMKVEPGRKVITGPFNLWVGDVPTPVGFLFGLFPTPKERSSGVVIPTFGQTLHRGFYLRNGGYYWAVNDYIGLKFLGDVYSFGGFGGTINADYYKRYAYRGNFNVTYNFYPKPDISPTAAVDLNIPLQNFANGDLYSVFWTHNPESRPGGGSFRASVNLRSPNSNQYSNDVGERIATTFTSTISYQNSIRNSPFNYSINIYHSQNNATRNVTVSLPEFSLGTTQIYPMRNLVKVPTGAWYEHITEQLNFTYRLDGKNQLTNYVGEGKTQDTLSFFRDFNRILQNGQSGAQHTFNITLGNYKLFKYFTFTPTVNYNEAWYLKQLDYKYINDTLVIDTLTQFSRVYQYQTGASLNTRFYGMYNFKGKVKAIRHVVSPQVSYSYTPNYALPSFNYYQWTQVDRSGKFEPRSRYANALYGTPPRGEQSNLNFQVTNAFEMKVVSKKDTITGYQKIKLIDNLSGLGSYNFAADSFNLSNLTVNLTTNLLERVALTMNFTFDPYQFDFNKFRRIDKLQLQGGNFSLARFTLATLDVSTDLNPDNWKREKRVSQNSYNIVPEPYATSASQTGVLPEYIDFDVKWSLFLGYYTSYLNPRYLKENERGQGASNITARGTLNPTEKWKVSFGTSFDLKHKDLTATRIDIYRDLHCWEMSIGWTPFGPAQGYFVNINVKSAMLRDLKISRNQTLQNRF